MGFFNTLETKLPQINHLTLLLIFFNVILKTGLCTTAAIWLIGFILLIKLNLNNFFPGTGWILKDKIIYYFLRADSLEDPKTNPNKCILTV